MTFFNKKRKIKTIYNNEINNENKIEFNKNTFSPIISEESKLKKLITLYDSEWIPITFYDAVGNISYSLTAGGYMSFSEIGTAQKEQEVPVSLNYSFIQDFEIEESLLPFINTTLMIKKHPRVRPTGILEYQSTVYDTSRYYRIKTGGVLAYQGYNASSSTNLQSEVDSGNIPSTHISKVMYGEINYTIGADTYRVVGDLVSISVYHSTVYVPGADDYDYTHFFTSTFDNISGNSITGQGTEQIATWVEDPPTVWTKELTDPDKEEDRTVNIATAGNTATIIVQGSKYKNGVYQSSGTHSITTIGNVNPGTASLISFTFAQKTSGGENLW